MITYPDSVRFLYSLGNELKAVKFGLDTMRAVLRELGHPERAVRAVHVAGTNGKGSTCAMIASGLREAGFSTGLFTSPHLVEPVERIQIDGVSVSAGEFSRAFDIVHQAAEKLLAAGSLETHPTYFETVTAMAFVLFRERNVDRVVLEVGLGGRLDATNVVTPELCVITPIDYDHESWLGATIDLIAAEKAGIIKPQVPVVIAQQREDAAKVLFRRAAELGAPVIPAPEADGFEAGPRGSIVHWRGLALQCPLAGVHQVGNTITAAEALRALAVKDNAILQGIARTKWPGRLEAVSTSPDIILDGAHNPAGARALAGYITRFYNHRKVWLIYATMRDKSVAEIADTLFPLAQELILTAPDSPRSLAPESLLPLSAHLRARIAPNLAAALELARAGASPDDVIFISGSLFLVGEARALLVR